MTLCFSPHAACRTGIRFVVADDRPPLAVPIACAVNRHVTHPRKHAQIGTVFPSIFLARAP
jgi:hypothetical protein